MALARIQASIVKNLLDMGHLSSNQYQMIIDTEEELSGEAVETLLLESYKINHQQLLIAKSRAFGMMPVNVRRCALNELTFAHLEHCLLYTSPSPRDGATSRMPSSA